MNRNTLLKPDNQGPQDRAEQAIPLCYRIGRGILRAGLGFYFSRIERFHRERVPATGPILFTSNHPNSLTDAFVIGTSVPRKVNFVATVRLFHLRSVRALLRRLGVIPINRVKDDPRAMRTVMDTFEACFRVLECGEAVGIFPEGVTHDDPQLRAPKTGAARMALDLEHRHGGGLGLQIVPVGLTFSAKETYRSQALVNFGEPIRVADFLGGYAERRHECIQALHAGIQQRIQTLMVHLRHLERARIVHAVKRLYLDRLQIANTVIHEPVTPQAGELLLTQAIARAVDAAYAKHPDRVEEFVRRLDHYEGWLKRLHLSDEVLAHFPDRERMAVQSAGWIVFGLVGAPVAFYGWLHRCIPYACLHIIVRRAAKQPADKTHVSSATILGGVVGFTAFYFLCAAVFHSFFGWPATFWYALSLPVSSLVAHYYVRELRRFAASLRAFVVLVRAPAAARRLLAERCALIELIAAERVDLQAAPAVLKGAS